jgi:hypothetical protein
MRSFVLLIGSLAGCAGSTSNVGQVRFSNANPVVRVNDRIDVPEKPKTRETALFLYHFDGTFHRRLTRAMELPAQRRALGVNSMDDVPDSTWFTNRIGVRELSVDEMRKGPEVVGSPEPHKPFTIKSSKVGGQSTGFIVTDSRGTKFLLKFDKKGLPEAETGADVIAGRILWAFGYNVPEDHVVYLKRSDLVVSEKSVVKDTTGHETKLTQGDVNKILDELVESEPDGRLRALASIFLEGVPIGGHRNEGVRKDDPNDRIPHERRRDLRGTHAVFSWLAHLDVKEHNTLDTWVTDPVTKQHYVKHYQIDFGKALGVMATGHRDMRDDHVYRIDWGEIAKNFITLGLRKRNWEDRRAPKIRGIGLYDIETYHPEVFKPNTPSYVPFHTRDRFDSYWAAKTLIRFTRPQLQAAVETARYSDPRATEYMVTALVARQRILARYWFERVAPLERFTIVDGLLCFEDLGLRYSLASSSETRYAVVAHDRAGKDLAPSRVVTSGGARTCVKVPIAPTDDNYTIVRIDTTRRNLDAGTLVHLARERQSGKLRVIGLRRL